MGDGNSSQFNEEQTAFVPLDSINAALESAGTGKEDPSVAETQVSKSNVTRNLVGFDDSVLNEAPSAQSSAETQLHQLPKDTIESKAPKYLKSFKVFLSNLNNDFKYFSRLFAGPYEVNILDDNLSKLKVPDVLKEISSNQGGIIPMFSGRNITMEIVPFNNNQDGSRSVGLQLSILDPSIENPEKIIDSFLSAIALSYSDPHTQFSFGESTVLWRRMLNGEEYGKKNINSGIILMSTNIELPKS